MDFKKAMIVDDEENICIFMTDMFVRKGFTPLATLDGEEAVELYEKHRPVVVIIDVHMPFSRLDGVEVLEKIKQMEPHARCLMVSRIEDQEVKRQSLKLGADDYFFKPVDIKKVEDYVEQVKQEVTNG